MSERRTESCGRCAISTVVDAVADGEGVGADGESDADANGEGGSGRDEGATGSDDRRRASAFGDARIELPDRALRATSPAAWLSGLVARLDAAASRFVYGPR